MTPCSEENIHAVSGPAFIEIARAVLDRGALFRFHATGNSMHPFIRNGDMVVLTRIPPAVSLCPGDVVLYQNPHNGNPLLHRIVAHRGLDFLLRGDNHSKPDGFVRREQILARVVSVVRKGRPTSLGLGPGRRILGVLVGTGLFYRMKQGAAAIRHSFFKGNA